VIIIIIIIIARLNDRHHKVSLLVVLAHYSCASLHALPILLSDVVRLDAEAVRVVVGSTSEAMLRNLHDVILSKGNASVERLACRTRNPEVLGFIPGALYMPGAHHQACTKLLGSANRYKFRLGLNNLRL